MRCVASRSAGGAWSLRSARPRRAPEPRPSRDPRVNAHERQGASGRTPPLGRSMRAGPRPSGRDRTVRRGGGPRPADHRLLRPVCRRTGARGPDDVPTGRWRTLRRWTITAASAALTATKYAGCRSSGGDSEPTAPTARAPDTRRARRWTGSPSGVPTRLGQHHQGGHQVGRDDALVRTSSKRSGRNSPTTFPHSTPFGHADQGPDRGGNGGLG